jgi:hypothetical protein
MKGETDWKQTGATLRSTDAPEALVHGVDGNKCVVSGLIFGKTILYCTIGNA